MIYHSSNRCKLFHIFTFNATDSIVQKRFMIFGSLICKIEDGLFIKYLLLFVHSLAASLNMISNIIYTLLTKLKMLQGSQCLDQIKCRYRKKDCEKNDEHVVALNHMFLMHFSQSQVIIHVGQNIICNSGLFRMVSQKDERLLCYIFELSMRML